MAGFLAANGWLLKARFTGNRDSEKPVSGIFKAFWLLKLQNLACKASSRVPPRGGGKVSDISGKVHRGNGWLVGKPDAGLTRRLGWLAWKPDVRLTREPGSQVGGSDNQSWGGCQGVAGLSESQI